MICGRKTDAFQISLFLSAAFLDVRIKHDRKQSIFGQPVYKLIEVITLDAHHVIEPDGHDLKMVILDMAFGPREIEVG